MTVIAAVSGGVDSVVLLHMLKQHTEHEIIVAHLDHGIRSGSAADARFVQALASSYGLPCEVRREELGQGASEATARERRYGFLRTVAEQRKGVIATAHHADDVVETIAINIERGTGWRGLACLNDPSINRPLLKLRKQQLYDYALQHQLEWVEDETNATGAYLRNTLRRKLGGLDAESHTKLLDLRLSQVAKATEIDTETNRFIQESRVYSRYFFISIVDEVAIEILRAILSEQNASLTRPQRSRLLHGIKTAKPGTQIELGEGVKASFTRTDFTIKTPR